jgi:aminopeptidase N
MLLIVRSKIIFCYALLLCLANLANAQRYEFSRDDTLRGSITPERAWWDLRFYDLQIRVSPKDSSIVGQNTIVYTIKKEQQIMQIDLQQPLKISKIIQDGKELTYKKDGPNAYFVNLIAPQTKGQTKQITVFYAGKPRVAKRAPWDGGFSWSKDKSGNDFVATSCQGLGSSVFWPCKDHMYDEPDSLQMAVTTPKGLMDVSNGRLRKTIENQDNTKTYVWFVKNPINNYGVNINMAKYEYFGDSYAGENGKLDLSYYVLPENLDKAKEQFKQVKLMLKAFEHWFGPYPFYEDGYKLVEVPYLGMEHQSSVTYGNKFQNGYLGRDLSGTGWGLKWDFIIVHESGHEWFANNITYKDAADMWLHESFTNYSEGLFTEYHFGKEAGNAYMIGLRKGIRNDRPIQGIYNVNYSGSGDMYNKGGNLLHTIRQLTNDDEQWRQTLRGLNKVFYHQTVTATQIENYLSQQVGRNLTQVFNQYIRGVKIPVLEYYQAEGQLYYRWANCIEGFDMPVKVSLKENSLDFIYPTTTWKSWPCLKQNKIKVDENFYVESKEIVK